MMEILSYPSVFPFMAIHERLKKQPLIKQSIKLYVVIKCHKSTEHHVQKNRAEGLSSFHMHLSFLFFFPVNSYKMNMLQYFHPALIYFEAMIFHYGKDVQFLSYLQIFPALLQT